ncbi:MAG: tRNA epoxyqueuosine(34) reductase QueG [Planctomycetota bacterium]
MNATELKSEAARLGFERCGIARAQRLADGENLRAFLGEGRQGTMEWLAADAERRADVTVGFPWARSVVVAALSYKPATEEAQPAGTGRVARYARGDDYHKVLRKKLRVLRDALVASSPGSHAVAVVDTSAIMEKPWAREAGVAWIGKHTNALDPGLGSYFSLGVVLTSLELEPDAPAPDHCGSCTRCLEACPTQALTAPYQIDATRCISYLTIEHAGPVDPALRKGIGDWVFGCDLCQEACPWNREAPATREPGFAARPSLAAPLLADWLRMTEAAWTTLTRGTALRRSKRSMLRRNAAIAIGNSGDPGAAALLEEAAADADPVVAGAARDAANSLKARPRP